MASKPSFKDVIRTTTALSIKRRKKGEELKKLYELSKVSPNKPGNWKKALKLMTDMNRYQTEIDRLDAFYPSPK
jgi:hypothetical protein